MGHGSETKGKFYGQRNHGAYGIYHFCFSFSNLFPIKSHSPIAKDRQINAVKAVSICFTCLEPVTVKVPKSEAVRPVLSSPNCRQDPQQSLPSCYFAGAWTNSS